MMVTRAYFILGRVYDAVYYPAPLRVKSEPVARYTTTTTWTSIDALCKIRYVDVAVASQA